MYPFLVMGLHHDVGDDEVEQRYRELVHEHPPDRDPNGFARVRRAYEALRTRRDRIECRLFYTDESGRALEQELPVLLLAQKPRRLAAGQLAELLEA